MTDLEQELFALYDSLPRSTLAMYLARDKLRIEKLEAELARQRDVPPGQGELGDPFDDQF